MDFLDLFEKKDLRPVLIKAGYTPEMAEWSHRIGKKYAGFVARAAFGDPRDVAEMQAEDLKRALQAGTTKLGRIQEVIRNLFQQQQKPKLPAKPADISLTQAENFVQELVYMRDWWTQPEVEGIVPQNYTWTELLTQAQQWYEAQRRRAEEEDTALSVDEGQTVFHKFDDNSYWLNLNTSSCRKEAGAMGHCGRSDGSGTLYSYRDVRGRPHLTADIFEDAGICGQVYGKGNTKPKHEYHRIILTLIGKLGLTKLRPSRHGEQSLAFDDLSSEDLEWFEKTFGYELTKGGVSDKEIKEADELVNTYDWEGPVNAYADFHSIEDYLHIRGSFYFDLTPFELTPEWKRADWRESSKMLEDISDGVFSGYSTEFDGQTGISVDFEDSGGYFNVEEGIGSTYNGHHSFDDIVEWARECCQDVDYYNDSATSLPTCVMSLVNANIISEECPLAQLIFHSEDDPNEILPENEELIPISDIEIKQGRNEEGVWDSKLHVKMYFRELHDKVPTLDSEVWKKIFIGGVTSDFEQQEFDFVKDMPKGDSSQFKFKHIEIKNELREFTFIVEESDARTLLQLLKAVEASREKMIHAINMFTSENDQAVNHVKRVYGIESARQFLQLF